MKSTGLIFSVLTKAMSEVHFGAPGKKVESIAKHLFYLA